MFPAFELGKTIPFLSLPQKLVCLFVVCTIPAPSNMGGFLIPSWYEAEVPSKLSLEFVTFLFGFSTACAVFTAVTIIQQAHRAWHRKKNLFAHTYIMMVSVEWLSSVIISVVSFLFVIAVIPPRFVSPPSPPPLLWGEVLFSRRWHLTNS